MFYCVSLFLYRGYYMTEWVVYTFLDVKTFFLLGGQLTNFDKIRVMNTA